MVCDDQSGQIRLPWLKPPPCFGAGAAFFFALAVAVVTALVAACLLADVSADIVDPADALRSLVFCVTVPVLLFRMEAMSLSPVLSLLVMTRSPVPIDHFIDQFIDFLCSTGGDGTGIVDTAALQHGITVSHAPSYRRPGDR
jgi:hypothetical protein